MSSRNNKVRVLAVDVLSEIESRVDQEIARIRDNESAEQKALTAQQEESMTHLYFAVAGKAIMEHYKEQGMVVKNRGYINTLISAAEMAVNLRVAEIDSGDYVSMPQMSDARASDSLSEGLGTGMSVQSSGWTEEDFRFGIGPCGGRKYVDALPGIDHDRLGERIRQGYSTEGKDVEEIIQTIPRKYDMKDQSYVLDVRKTLQEAGIHGNSPGYMTIERALEEEKHDPETQDRLRQMYAELELREVDEFEEMDD